MGNHWQRQQNMTQTTRSTATKPARRISEHPGFWMRSVQFAGLHRILHRLAQQRAGVRANDIDRLIIESGDYRTGRGKPSKTTLYHCRTTLLNLGALKRVEQRWTISFQNRHVARLLDIRPVGQDEKLPRPACDAFASLAIANHDCYRNFFRLFVPSGPASAEDFRQTASAVVWRSLIEDGPNKYELRRATSKAAATCKDSIRLTAPIQVQSILYGVRDWACKQLDLLGEFHETGLGSVLYPLRHPECVDASAAVRDAMLAVPPDSAEWTTVSVADLLRRLCELEGYPVAAVHRGITAFVQAHPGNVGLIATIPNWAMITATTRRQADFHLETAYRDVAGRIISHLRFHHCVREQHNGKKNGKRRRAATG